MTRTVYAIVAVCTVLLPLASVGVAEDAVQPTEKTALFDGKTFDGLVRYVRGGGEVGDTWQIKPDGVLACTGKPSGYIRTVKAYKNYKVRFEYRWAGKTGNNGVLVHMTGEDNVWPKSLECQGMFANQGDFFEIGGVEFNEHKIGGHRVSGRRVKKYDPANEKEPGQWNVYEVWCVGGTVRPYVNGKLMNEASDCSMTEGKICLQSEGAPIEFRNVTIEPAGEGNKPWPVTPTKKIELFNGKDLTGWVRFIPNDQPAPAPAAEPPAKRKRKPPVGPFKAEGVWSVEDGVIRCTGVPNGYIRTCDSYANYKLHVEWRWPEKPTNSGVLLHRTGIDKVWPKCVEAQLKDQGAGDIVLLGDASITAGGKKMGGKGIVAIRKKDPANEKPAGQWNSYDIVCDGGSVTLTVNGKLLNQGAGADPSSGPIGLQSEGSPIEFRNVYIEPLDK